MSCEHMNLTVRQEELGMHNAWAHVCGGAPFHHAKHGLSVPVQIGVCPLKHEGVSADVCLLDHCGSCTKEQCTEQRQEADSVERLHRPQQRELVKLTVQREWVKLTEQHVHWM